MAPLSSAECSFDDVIIGEPESHFMPINSSNGMLDPDDFMLGEEVDDAPPVSQAKSSDQDPLVLEHEVQDETLDFHSINDLITSELNETSFPTKKEEPLLLVDEVASPKAPESVEVECVQHLEEELGQDFQSAEEAVRVCNKIRADMKRLNDVERVTMKDRPVILATLHQNQKELREHHQLLQDVISDHIRRGDFDRVGAIDQVKRKIDDLMLQMRAIENRLTNKGVKLSTGTYLDGTFAEDIYREAENNSSTMRQKGKGQEKGKRKGRSRRAPGQSRGVSRGVKVFLVLMLFALMPICYYLSANWGVTPSKKIDVSTYAAVVPLVHARGVEQAFNGVLDDAWQSKDLEAKELAVRQLAAMVQVDGYQTIFLTYSTKGIAAIYNAKQDKLVVK